MKPRLVFVALLTGLLASQILSIIFKDVWPGYIAPDYNTAGIYASLAWVGYAVAALLIFACGYASARLEWSHNWKDALQTGVGAGLLAGCLAYLLSYAPVASGLMGQKEILLSIPHPIINEQEGLKLLVQGIVNTVVWVQGIFWVFMLSSITLGGLGGLLSRLEGSNGWGKAPTPKAPFVPRLTVYAIGFFAAVNLMLTVATMQIMPDIITRTMTNNVGPVDGLLLPPWAVLTLPLITATIFLAVCLIFIVQWAFQSWRYPEKRFRVKISLVISGLAMLALFVWTSYPLAWLILAMLIVIGLVLWVRQRIQPAVADQEMGDTQPYNVLDMLASALTQGIVLSAVAVGSTIAHALTLVLITVVNIPHLTNSGPVESTAQEQISSLYTTSGAQNVTILLVTSIGGLVIVAIALLVRKVLLTPRPQPINELLSNEV
ncbi:MAG: hypothetical protein QM796_12130 [Chthoniobacteraceae bacterium]